MSLFKKTSQILEKIQKIQKNIRDSRKEKKVERIEPIVQSSSSIQEVALSSKSVAKATLTILGILLVAYGLFLIQDMIIIFCVSVFLASALDPAVDAMEKRKIPRGIGVFLLFILILGFFITIIGSMIPIVIEQIQNLVHFFGEISLSFLRDIQSGNGISFIPNPYRLWIINTLNSINIDTLLREILKNMSHFTGEIQNIATGSLLTLGTTVGAGVSVAGSVLGVLIDIVLMLVLTFFMVVDRDGLKVFFFSLFPRRYGNYLTEKTQAIQVQIGAWLRGQLLLCLVVSGIMFLGLILIGMGKYALTLSLIVGFGEFLPFIGLFIFLIIATPIALGMGFITFLKFLVIFAIVQFLENNVLFPLIMGKSLGMSPIVMILVVIIGFQFFGFIGAFMSIPVTTAITIFLSDYTKSMAEK